MAPIPAFLAPLPLSYALRTAAPPTTRHHTPVASAKPPRKSASSPAPLDLGTPSRKSRINAGRMAAMGDYFGDDGRELEDYLQRPRGPSGPALRVLIIGSGAPEARLASTLVASGRMRGLYYAASADGAGAMADVGSASDSTVAAGAVDDVVRFCRWAFVDCVFVGSGATAVGVKVEAQLAADGVTVFAGDVSAAVEKGAMSVDDCFASISEELDEAAPSTQLVE